MKSWRTTVFGLILGLATAGQQYGIKIGHVGRGDFLGLAQIVAAMGLGYNSKDKQTTGPQT